MARKLKKSHKHSSPEKWVHYLHIKRNTEESHNYNNRHCHWNHKPNHRCLQFIPLFRMCNYYYRQNYLNHHTFKTSRPSSTAFIMENFPFGEVNAVFLRAKHSSLGEQNIHTLQIKTAQNITATSSSRSGCTNKHSYLPSSHTCPASRKHHLTEKAEQDFGGNPQCHALLQKHA